MAQSFSWLLWGHNAVKLKLREKQANNKHKNKNVTRNPLTAFPIFSTDPSIHRPFLLELC